MGRFGALDPFQAREILDDKKDENIASGGTDFLNLNQMVSSDYRRPDEKFNIRVTIDCISKFIQPKQEGIDSGRYHEGLKKPISGFERIITGKEKRLLFLKIIKAQSPGKIGFDAILVAYCIVHHFENERIVGYSVFVAVVCIFYLVFRLATQLSKLVDLHSSASCVCSLHPNRIEITS